MFNFGAKGLAPWLPSPILEDGQSMPCSDSPRRGKFRLSRFGTPLGRVYVLWLLLLLGAIGGAESASAQVPRITYVELFHVDDVTGFVLEHKWKKWQNKKRNDSI